MLFRQDLIVINIIHGPGTGTREQMNLNSIKNTRYIFLGKIVFYFYSSLIKSITAASLVDYIHGWINLL